MILIEAESRLDLVYNTLANLFVVVASRCVPMCSVALCSVVLWLDGWNTNLSISTIPMHSILIHSTPLHSTPFRCTPLHSDALHSTPLHSRRAETSRPIQHQHKNNTIECTMCSLPVSLPRSIDLESISNRIGGSISLSSSPPGSGAGTLPWHGSIPSPAGLPFAWTWPIP